MKILVAGGAGYVGSALVPRLLSRGYGVTVVDVLWFGNYLPQGVEVLRKDILDLTVEDVQGFDQVIFLAGLSNDPMADFSPSLNFVSNAACPAYLAYIAKKAGARRYIYASSCSVYGYTVDEFYDETGPTVSHYPYGISKLQGETAALGLVDDGFSVIALRKGTICGYSPRMRLDLVVNTMFKTAVQEGVVHVNHPSIWRPILAMQDAVSAYVRAIECSETISGIFNIASGNYTIGELGDYVIHGLKEHMELDVTLDLQRRPDIRNYKVSTEKAEHVLSFKPRHDIESIVHELVEHREAFADFDQPNYYNIEKFKDLGLQARVE
jgi:nucleoside-diphosphate-sugar epimerase